MSLHSALVLDVDANLLQVTQCDESFWSSQPGRVGRSDSATDLAGPMIDIAVEWSSLNYKDALAIDPAGQVARLSPLIPGIDLAGYVLDAPPDSGFAVGAPVIAHGYELGVAWHGGFATFARVPARWVTARPAALTARVAMIFGTAGYTAALAVMALEARGLAPNGGPIVVTGASGGVGSCAVAMLSLRGYEVVAVTAKTDAHQWLIALGAANVITREELHPHDPPRPLETERWQAGVDVVGGETLASVLRATRYGGSVATTGLAGGADVTMTVHPFILRAVQLIGIDSAYNTQQQRSDVWHALATDFGGINHQSLVADSVGLAQIPDALKQLRAAQVTGRIIVEVDQKA